MQDSAPGYAVAFTQAELREWNIYLIFQPPYSLDLNLIESAWDWIKDYIQDYYPNNIHKSYNRLREAVRVA